MSLTLAARPSKARQPVRAEFAGAGWGWQVVGPGVVAGVRQTVIIARPYTTREAAELRAAFELGRHDARTLPLEGSELRAVRILARQADSRERRAYWLGVRWQATRQEPIAGRIGGPGWSVKA